MNVRSIQRCRDITDDHINAAIESRGDTRGLLEHLVAISKPREAGARVLLVFAKMASPACDWLDGALRIEIARDGTGTVIESFSVIGAGLKERVFPRLVFNVPFEEFLVAIKKFPQAIAPMSIELQNEDKLSLSAAEAEKVLAEDDDKPAPRLPTPALGVRDLPTVGLPSAPSAPSPLAKLKLQRRNPALGHTISEEIVTKPKRDSRRESTTGENPALPLIVPVAKPEPKEDEKPRESGDDVDTGWE